MTTETSADETAFDGLFEKPTEPTTTPPPETPPPVQTDLEDAIQAVDQQRMVPLSELIAERKKYKGQLSELEKRAIEADARAKAYETFAPRQQQPQRQVPIPDPVTDPENYARYVHHTTEQRLFIDGLNRSEERARDKFGDSAVEEALEAAKAAGLIDRQFFIQSNPRHPFGALMDWHKQQKVLATVGDDPDAYRKKIEEEIRAKLLKEGATGQTGAAPTRFPGTLADNTAAGPQGAHLTEGAAMGALFDTNRKRK